MMIDENETFERFGYHSDDWAIQSAKQVVAICDGCGDAREIQKRFANRPCLKCACNTPARREMLSRTHKGKVVSDDQKRKQSDKMSGRKQSEDHIEKRKQSLTGLKRTDEQKQNMSRAQKGRTVSPEHRAKLSQSHTGKTHTDETRQKMSEVRKGIPKTDQMRQRLSETKCDRHPMKGEHWSKDCRIAMSSGHQHIPVEEWDGFIAGIRDHVLPIFRCTKINEWFPGCEGHHLSRSLVVFIPSELHNHFYHNMKTGQGMAEMNALALQFTI